MSRFNNGGLRRNRETRRSTRRNHVLRTEEQIVVAPTCCAFVPLPRFSIGCRGCVRSRCLSGCSFPHRFLTFPSPSHFAKPTRPQSRQSTFEQNPQFKTILASANSSSDSHHLSSTISYTLLSIYPTRRLSLPCPNISNAKPPS